MTRERVLKVLLVLIGLALIAGIYPLVTSLLNHGDVTQGDQMILGIYVPIGIFLVLAARNPAANRSLILCFAWSTLGHDAVMVVQALQHNVFGRGDLPGFGVIAVICLLLLALAPRKERARTSAAGA